MNTKGVNGLSVRDDVYRAAFERASEAGDNLLGVLVREPYLAKVHAAEINLRWFDFCKNKNAAHALFQQALSHAGGFSVASIASRAVGDDVWLDLAAKGVGLSFEQALNEFADAVAYLLECQIAILTLSEWSWLSADEIASKATRMRLDYARPVGAAHSDRFEQWFEQKVKGGVIQYKCYNPIPPLANLLPGFAPGDLYIIAGRPSQGKTQMALNLMLPWLDDGARGIMVSLDMNVTRFKARMLSMMTAISAERDWSLLPESDLRKLTEAKERISKYNLVVFDTTSDIDFLERHIRAEHAREPVDFVIIDYVQLCRSASAQGRYQSLTEVVERLKVLCKAINAPIIALSQIRRPEGTVVRMPSLVELRDSGALEETASAVLMLHRPEFYEEGLRPGIGLVSVAKNQHGPTDHEIVLAFNSITGWSSVEDYIPF